MAGGQFSDRPKCHKVAKVLLLFLCNITEMKVFLKFSWELPDVGVLD